MANIYLIFATFVRSWVKKISSLPQPEVVITIVFLCFVVWYNFWSHRSSKAQWGMSIKCVASSNCAWHIFLYLKRKINKVIFTIEILNLMLPLNVFDIFFQILLFSLIKNFRFIAQTSVHYWYRYRSCLRLIIHFFGTFMSPKIIRCKQDLYRYQ